MNVHQFLRRHDIIIFGMPKFTLPFVGFKCVNYSSLSVNGTDFNSLALELDIYSLAHHLCKT